MVIRCIPAAWPDKLVMMPYAQLYYTLDKFGVARREAIPVFHAIRDEGLPAVAWFISESREPSVSPGPDAAAAFRLTG